MLARALRRGPATGRFVCLLGLLAVLGLSCGCVLGKSGDPSALVYKLPTRIRLDAGQALPGTNIRYERMDETGAQMTIGGQAALKRKGDSLAWDGEPRPGVKVELRLRVVWIAETHLELLGTARIAVSGTQPKRATISTSSPMEYGGPVAYSVDKTKTIPGSTLTYEGEEAEGAKLGNTDAYPYRRAGDSIFWEGTLRDGVYLRLDVRAVQFDERHLRVAGLATIWIGP